MNLKNRTLLVGLAVSISTCGLSGCSSKDNSDPLTKQAIVWRLSSEPTTFDPQVSNSFETQKVINHLFEGLYRIKTVKPEPAMAESCKISEGGSVYTFKIRDSKWSDGKPVRAQDFVFSWRRALSADVENQDVMAYEVIKNAKEILDHKKKPEELCVFALDDKTLKVELVAPVQDLAGRLACPAFFPLREDVVNSDGSWANRTDTIVSNGPYSLKQCAMNEEITLEKSSSYYGASEIKTNQIVFKVMTNENSAYIAYKQGKLNAISDVSENVVKDAIGTGEFHAEPSLDTYMLLYNFSNPVLKKKEVRNALSMAVDREKLVRDVIGNTGEHPAVAVIPYGFFDSKGNEIRDLVGDYGRSTNNEDLARARELLEKAGYPGGKGFPELKITYNTNPSNDKIMGFLQEQWKQNLNIDVKPAGQEWATYETFLNDKAFPGLCRVRWGVGFPDVTETLEMFKTDPKCKNPQAQYNCKEYDDLINLIKQSVGETRDKAVYKAEGMLNDDVVCMPLFYGVNSLLIKPNIKNWHLSSMGTVYFGDAYIEQ